MHDSHTHRQVPEQHCRTRTPQGHRGEPRPTVAVHLCAHQPRRAANSLARGCTPCGFRSLLQHKLVNMFVTAHKPNKAKRAKTISTYLANGDVHCSHAQLGRRYGPYSTAAPSARGNLSLHLKVVLVTALPLLCTPGTGLTSPAAQPQGEAAFTQLRCAAAICQASNHLGSRAQLLASAECT